MNRYENCILGCAELQDLYKNIDFDILALGEDHIGERFDNIVKWCDENGKKVVRLKRTPGIASSEIKKNLMK